MLAAAAAFASVVGPSAPPSVAAFGAGFGFASPFGRAARGPLPFFVRRSAKNLALRAFSFSIHGRRIPRFLKIETSVSDYRKHAR